MLALRSQALGLQRYLMGWATASAPPKDTLAVHVATVGSSRTKSVLPPLSSVTTPGESLSITSTGSRPLPERRFGTT